jgi:hypothetical protein
MMHMKLKQLSKEEEMNTLLREPTQGVRTPKMRFDFFFIGETF